MVAMGWGVAFEDTYGQRLEALLTERYPEVPDFEVINAGVPGWNLENELAYLMAEGYKYDPDLVLLDLTIVNDIYGKNATAPNERPAIIEWMRSNTHLWPFISIQVQWIEARADGKERISVIDPPVKPDSYFPSNPESEKWSEITGLIRRMNEFAGQNQMDFMVILFPLEHQVVDPGYSTLPQEVLARDFTDSGIAYIDLLDSYREACYSNPEDPCALEDYSLFADVWMHPSRLGNQITAGEILEAISPYIPKS